MPYVITEPCIGSKDTACYDVCPVDAIQPAPDGPSFDTYDQMFIDPAACIECGACEAVCPVEAIYDERDVPEQYQAWIATNRRFFNPASPDPNRNNHTPQHRPQCDARANLQEVQLNVTPAHRR